MTPMPTQSSFLPEEYEIDPREKYRRDVYKATTLKDLKRVLHAWSRIAQDAVRSAPKNEAEFREFRVGLEVEKSMAYAGLEWHKKYSNVACPQVIFITSVMCAVYHKKWEDTATILKEKGYIIEDKFGNLSYRYLDGHGD